MPDIETYGGQCPQCLRPMLQKFHEGASPGFNYDACPWCGHIQAEGVTGLPDEYGPLTRHEAWQTLFHHLLQHEAPEVEGRLALILQLDLSPDPVTEEQSDFWPSVFIYEHRQPEGNPEAVNEAEQMWAAVRMHREMLEVIREPMDAAHGWTVTESVHPLPANVTEAMERLRREVLEGLDPERFVGELREQARRSRELASLLVHRPEWWREDVRARVQESLRSYADGLGKMAAALDALLQPEEGDEDAQDLPA